MTKIIEVTDVNFQKEVLESKIPVLVDFWAEWCMPCLTLGPILEKSAKACKDKIILAKVNLDTAPRVSQKYRIEQIPTVILFDKGKSIGDFIGLRPESAIKQWLEENLKKR